MSFLFIEKLEVWHDARKLANFVYDITSHFPTSEKYGLINQMRRSAISVVSNIAEGSGRTSSKDQSHFFQIAFSNCIELLNQLILSNDLKYISEEDLIKSRLETGKITNKLNALRSYLRPG